MVERERPPEHRDDGRPGSSGSPRSGARPGHGPGPLPDDEHQSRQYLLARFWDAALGFWRRGGGPDGVAPDPRSSSASRW